METDKSVWGPYRSTKCFDDLRDGTCGAVQRSSLSGTGDRILKAAYQIQRSGNDGGCNQRIFYRIYYIGKGASEFEFTGVVDDEESISNDNANYELGSGIVNVLNPGDKIEIADSKRPSSNFDAFVTSLAKYVGAALEIPVELLIKSFTSSYSASRASLLEAWKAFRMKRKWLASDLCQPVYEIFLTEAVASGRIKAPGFFLDPAVKKAYCGAQWNGPAPGMIDPVKDATAAEKRIAIGVSTRQREAIEMTGTDFDANIVQLARENQLMEENGLITWKESQKGAAELHGNE